MALVKHSARNRMINSMINYIQERSNLGISHATASRIAHEYASSIDGEVLRQTRKQESTPDAGATSNQD